MIFNWKLFRPENTFNKLMHNYLFSYFIIIFFYFLQLPNVVVHAAKFSNHNIARLI